jgi:hypothetical protein
MIRTIHDTTPASQGEGTLRQAPEESKTKTGFRAPKGAPPLRAGLQVQDEPIYNQKRLGLSKQKQELTERERVSQVREEDSTKLRRVFYPEGPGRETWLLRKALRTTKTIQVLASLAHVPIQALSEDADAKGAGGAELFADTRRHMNKLSRHTHRVIGAIGKEIRRREATVRGRQNEERARRGEHVSLEERNIRMRRIRLTEEPAPEKE